MWQLSPAEAQSSELTESDPPGQESFCSAGEKVRLCLEPPQPRWGQGKLNSRTLPSRKHGLISPVGKAI